MKVREALHWRPDDGNLISLHWRLPRIADGCRDDHGKRSRRSIAGNTYGQLNIRSIRPHDQCPDGQTRIRLAVTQKHDVSSSAKIHPCKAKGHVARAGLETVRLDGHDCGWLQTHLNWHLGAQASIPDRYLSGTIAYRAYIAVRVHHGNRGGTRGVNSAGSTKSNVTRDTIGVCSTNIQALWDSQLRKS